MESYSIGIDCRRPEASPRTGPRSNRTSSEGGSSFRVACDDLDWPLARPFCTLRTHSGRPDPRSSTATSGSVWPAWSDTRSGERSPCRSSRTCTSEPKMSAGWRPTTAGSSTPSWSWPPPRSSGWSSSWRPDHPPIWVVTDGAYVKRPFLKRVLAAGVTVISRLRCDAALWSLPPVVDPGQKKGRGRPPK